MPTAVLAEPTASKPAKADWRNIPKKKRQQEIAYRGVDGNSKLGKIAKPFTKKARRIITKKTEKLIKKRNEIDHELLIEAQREKLSPNDWLPREKLLRRQAALEKREERHIRRRTRKLAEVERLYKWDPSADRAFDYDLIRYLLWKFKRHLGPLIEHHHKRENAGDSSSDTDSDSASEWGDISNSEDVKDESKNESAQVPSRKRSREGTEEYRASKKRNKTNPTTEESVASASTKNAGKGTKTTKKKNRKNIKSEADMEQASDN